MPRPRSAHALLLVLGVFAVMLHALAGMGLMRSHTAASSGKFVAEICTAAGFARTTGDHSHPSHGDSHDCCKLCAASGPLLLTDTAIAVPPAPTFTVSVLIPASARLASFAWTAHPPRGPPARI